MSGPANPHENPHVVVYLTRSGARVAELLVEDAPAEALGYKLPATALGAGEHPCEAADRLVARLLAPVGLEALPFAYRKVAGAPRHAFVTAAEGALPDRIGGLRWVPLGDDLPWM